MRSSCALALFPCLSLINITSAYKARNFTEEAIDYSGFVQGHLNFLQRQDADSALGRIQQRSRGYLQGPYQYLAEQECQPEETQKQKWAEYKSFHAQCRQDESCMRRAVIWKCEDYDLCGGLGDELRGLAFSLYAAIAAKRPFFVSWSKMGQNILALFEKQEGVDVSVPPGLLQGCETRNMIDWHPEQDALTQFLSSTKEVSTCESWVTNIVVTQTLFDRRMLQEYLPWLVHVQPRYAIGCAMSFLFKPSSPDSVPEMWQGRGGRNFSVIHYRVDDSAIGEDDQSNNATYSVHIRKALQCATSHDISSILFLSASEAAKKRALQMSTDFGIQLHVSKGVAKHIDQDPSQLTSAEFESAVWNDFVAIQQAQYLLFAGRVSGFAGNAASMSFLPSDHVLDNSCSPVASGEVVRSE